LLRQQRRRRRSRGTNFSGSAARNRDGRNGLSSCGCRTAARVIQCLSVRIRILSAKSYISSTHLTSLKELLPLNTWRGLPKSSRLGRGRTSWRDCSSPCPFISLLLMALPLITAMRATSLKEFYVGRNAMPLYSGPGARRPVAPSPWRQIRREPGASFRCSRSFSEATKTLPFPTKFAGQLYFATTTPSVLMKLTNKASKL
jgi:hypothetical protein